jgi:hypothetical protein
MIEPYLRPKKLLNIALTTAGIGFAVVGPYMAQHFPAFGKIASFAGMGICFTAILIVHFYMPD